MTEPLKNVPINKMLTLNNNKAFRLLVIFILCWVSVYLQLIFKFSINNILFLWLGFCIFVILIIPGYILTSLIFKKIQLYFFELLPMSLCFGLLYLAPFAIFSYLVNLSITFLAHLYLIAVFLLLLGYYKIINREIHYNRLDICDKPSRKIIIILLMVILLFFIISLYFGGYISGNFLFHMSFIRKLVEFPGVQYHNAYIKQYSTWTYIYNVWYIFIAMLSKISNVDPIKVWIEFPSIILPFGILSSFMLARMIFKNNLFALISTFIFCIMNSLKKIGFWFWAEDVTAPNFTARTIIAFIVLYLFFAIIFNKLKDKKYFIVLSLLGCLLCFMHMYYYLTVIYIILCWIIFALIFDKDSIIGNKKIIKSLAYFVFPSIIIIIFMFNTLSPTINPAYLHPDKIRYDSINAIKFITDKLFIIDYNRATLNNPISTISLFIFPFLLLLIKKEKALIYPVSIMVVTLFIFFNPFLLKIIKIFHPPMDRIYRLVEIIPFEYIVGYILYRAYIYYYNVKSKTANLLKNYKFHYIVILTLMISIFNPIRDIFSSIEFTKKSSYKKLEDFSNPVSIVREYIPSGSTVLIDFDYATFWTAYFPHYIVACTLYGVLPPNVDQTERVKFIEDVLANSLNDKNISKLNEYQVNYILLKNDNNKAIINMHEYPNKLTLIHENNLFKIFKVI